MSTVTATSSIAGRTIHKVEVRTVGSSTDLPDSVAENSAGSSTARLASEVETLELVAVDMVEEALVLLLRLHL